MAICMGLNVHSLQIPRTDAVYKYARLGHIHWQ